MRLSVTLSLVGLALGEVHGLERYSDDPALFKPQAKGPAADVSLNSSVQLSALFSRSNQLGGLFWRQEQCAYPVPCDRNIWCCPAGSKCCATILDCCPEGSECRADFPGKCCPDTAQTCGGKYCAEEGSECCSDYVCPAGLQCNEEGGGQNCCQQSELHCNDACCPEGSACATIAGYCSSIRPTSIKPSTASRTTASTKSSAILTTSVSVSESTLTSTVSSASAVCTPGTTRRSLEERQRPFPDYCLRVCNVASKQELPVWELSSNPGETDQLIYSMCYGITERLKTGSIQSGLDDGEDVLEYNGKGVRNEAKCGGYCRDVSLASGLGVGSFQCDEYPPATLNPKGGAQTRWCVPRYQNSGTQGPMLSNFLQRCGVKANDKILVKIKGGCKSYNFPTKRDDSHIPILRSRANIELDSSNATLRNPQGDGSLLYVAVEIDELADGHYDFTVKFDGQIDNATIMNKYGEEYANAELPIGETTLSFDINDGSNLPAALIAWTSKAINVTYAGIGQLSNGTTTSASTSATSPPVSTTTSKSGSEKIVVAEGAVIFLHSVIIFMLI